MSSGLLSIVRQVVVAVETILVANGLDEIMVQILDTEVSAHRPAGKARL